MVEQMGGCSGPRGCRAEELPQVVALADRVFSPQKRMGPEFPTLFHPDNGEWLRTFWSGGEVVALLGIWRGRVHAGPVTLAVAHVGAVCTHPDFRGRGLASALLLDGLTRLRAAGAALVLISGGRGLYQRVGARPFGVLLRYAVDATAWERMPLPDVTVAPAQDPDALMSLYRAEPFRYERTPTAWRALLPAKGYLPAGRGHGALVATQGGVPVAYLLLGATDPLEEGGVALAVDEYAGDREAVLVAVGAALRQAGATRVHLQVRPGDVELRRLLEAADLMATPTNQQGTARILDPTAFPPLNPWEPAPALPELPYGDPEEAEASAALTCRLLGPGGLELPRNDGLNYI